MKASIKGLILSNPSGLLELQPALTFQEYYESFGFKLKNVWTIYKSKKIALNYEEWFSFLGHSLENLFQVYEESDGDQLVVFIVETIKSGKVHCHLILSDAAYSEMLGDKSCHILQVHQMYTTGLNDRNHIALNMSVAN